MEDIRFNYLLEKYSQKETTPDEEEELKALFLTGRYHDNFRNDLAQFMENLFRSPTDSTSPVDADQLYEKILEKTQQKNRVKRPAIAIPGYWIRIAAMLVIGLAVAWWLQLPASETNQTLLSTAEVKAENEEIRFTKKDFIRLPDGSTVLLNDESELTYSSSTFGKTTREVTLKGEAFFDISPSPDKVFIVHTGDISTNVLGTAFNINTRNENIVVTVERGLVRVDDHKKPLSMVRPDERLVVNTVNHQFEKTEVKIREEIAWKAQSLVFDDISLKQTVELLQDRFGADIRIDNPDIEDCRITAWFLENESLEEILEMVCGIRQARYDKNGGLFTISGGITCK